MERIRKAIAWTPYKRELFYVPGENNTEGYIDYPFAEESNEAEVQP